MAKKHKRSPSSNDFLLVPPPQAQEFEHANTCFGKNVEQQIENPGEWSAREERQKGPFGASAEWTKPDTEGSDADPEDHRKDRKY